ncbi:integrase core domain-containing protein [Thiomicrospira sp. R3]|uniref:integrase core domain-containing protein n=1 Tax=Thiomicrospira sp. R3 TaxID=3035472 RepID=UPI00259B0B36|nr:integrase core domain-containing protein [Thiomicrospira sp. R3]WFE68179.1 integrase core domain-containing protein [Thiomicrospira sp. R3]
MKNTTTILTNTGDLYSRYGVSWEVHAAETGHNATELMNQAVIKQKLVNAPKPVLHSDNGSIMKSMTLKAKLESLGIQQSFSRPRVSNDNAYIESFFRTLKYVPNWPTKGFSDIEHARRWVQSFMGWYNEQHLHSRLKFVTPGQRYRGEDKQILTKRAQVYEQAKAKNPARWRSKVRDWTPIGAVALNPDNLERVNG